MAKADREVCEKCGQPVKVNGTHDQVQSLSCPCGALRGKRVVLRTVGVFIRLAGHPKRIRVGFKGDRRKRKR